MNNPYREMMEQQCLSDHARQAICRKLQCPEQRKPHSFYLRPAIAAVCILLIIPITAYAVKALFGISIVEIIKGNAEAGYEVDYPQLYSRKLSDFPEEIQTMEDHRRVIYDSWQDAEDELGITLVNNAFLSDERVTKEHPYILKDGNGKAAHCFGQYFGLDGRFYRATIFAAYRYEHMFITLSSTVTCEHPAISKEKEYEMHGHGVRYKDRDVEEIVQEQYLAENGITATVITVTRNRDRSAYYDATFSANGASYRITVQSYGKGQDAEAKAVLIRILEGFQF